MIDKFFYWWEEYKEGSQTENNKMTKKKKTLFCFVLTEDAIQREAINSVIPRVISLGNRQCVWYFFKRNGGIWAKDNMRKCSGVPRTESKRG